MKPVQREDIIDYVTYGEQRGALRDSILEMKALRRIHLGAHLTFLFETTETIRYQIQEMMRVEQIVKEADIQHEIDTYNELLGDTGELGGTLLIEIADADARAEKLQAWIDLPDHLFAVLADGTRVPISIDERQVGEDKLSSVQYIKFKTEGQVPVSLLCDHPQLSTETFLTPEQQTALAEDLR